MKVPPLPANQTPPRGQNGIRLLPGSPTPARRFPAGSLRRASGGGAGRARARPRIPPESLRSGSGCGPFRRTRSGNGEFRPSPPRNPQKGTDLHSGRPPGDGIRRLFHARIHPHPATRPRRSGLADGRSGWRGTPLRQRRELPDPPPPSVPPPRKTESEPPSESLRKRTASLPDRESPSPANPLHVRATAESPHTGAEEDARTATNDHPDSSGRNPTLPGPPQPRSRRTPAQVRRHSRVQTRIPGVRSG